MPCLVWLTARAERDIVAAVRYIQRYSRPAAVRWYAGLMEAIQSLEDHPERFGLVPEADALELALRQRLFGKRQGDYRILFTVHGNTVHVLHIRRAARRPLRPGDL